MRAHWMILLGLPLAMAVGCRPSDVLSVPAPAGVETQGSLNNQTGAEATFTVAKFRLFKAIAAASGGLLTWSGLLSDELTMAPFNGRYNSRDANIDARLTTAHGGFAEAGDFAWGNLLSGRSAVLLASGGLAKYEPAAGQSKVGEAYALAGYAEVFLAEDYCSGTPLDAIGPSGIQYGMPLSNDSLLAVAASHFDSALRHANGDATVENLARVGLGRALLDRGRFDSAGRVVASVATSFVYNTELEPNWNGAPYTPNLYASGMQYASTVVFNVADGEGNNGLRFVSAHDPRLVLDSTTYRTAANTAWRVPTKFEANPSFLPLATGIEARLIEAEAALRAGQVNVWASDLRALRSDSADAHVTFPAADSLPADSAESAPSDAQVNVMFRERAFWLFGFGTRLGDMRRLIRQYGRNQQTVFPVGSYPDGTASALPSPLAMYGADVALTLPTPAGIASEYLNPITNPHYAGCTTPATVP